MGQSDAHLLLFNRAAYLQSVVTAPSAVWRYDHAPDGRLVGSWVGVRTGDRLELGYRAPFAGPDVVGDPSPGTVLDLLGCAFERARADGISDILVRARPRSYGPAEDVVQYGLLQLGFTVECCDLSFAVALAGLTDLDHYLAALPAKDRNPLRQVMALEAGFRILDPEDDPQWRPAFDILTENRRSKGRHMSIDFDYLAGLRDRMPGLLHMALLEVERAACAAALLYRVTPEVMLLVNWGDAFHQLRRSPMNLLAAHITVWSAGQGARLLDMGRATEDGPPNLGLMQFKRSVMGRPEMRPNYRWRG